MRLIIAGPRDLYPSDAHFERAITRVSHEANKDVSKIITGEDSGVERCAWHYGIRRHISVYVFETHRFRDIESGLSPELNKGKSELAMNIKMLEEGDALLILKSKRLDAPEDYWNMSFLAEKVGMPVYIEEVKG